MGCAKCGNPENKRACRLCNACAYAASLHAPAEGQPCLSCWSADAVESGRCADCAEIARAEHVAAGGSIGYVQPVARPDLSRGSYRPGPMSDGNATVDAIALALLPAILVALCAAVLAL